MSWAGNWVCHTFVPPQVLVLATLRSHATGLFQSSAEFLRRRLRELCTILARVFAQVRQYAEERSRWSHSRAIRCANALPCNGHQLCVAPRGLAVSRRDLGPAFKARNRLGCQ